MPQMKIQWFSLLLPTSYLNSFEILFTGVTLSSRDDFLDCYQRWWCGMTQGGLSLHFDFLVIASPLFKIEFEVKGLWLCIVKEIGANLLQLGRKLYCLTKVTTRASPGRYTLPELVWQSDQSSPVRWQLSWMGLRWQSFWWLQGQPVLHRKWQMLTGQADWWGPPLNHFSPGPCCWTRCKQSFPNRGKRKPSSRHRQTENDNKREYEHFWIFSLSSGQRRTAKCSKFSWSSKRYYWVDTVNRR